MTTEPDLEASIAAVEEEFGRLFHRARTMWRLAAARVHPDLQPTGYKVVSTLVSRGPAHAGSLAEELQIDKSLLSRQLRQLEELGLTESRVDEHDARSRVIAATPLAIEKVGEAKAANRAQMRERLREWEPHEIELFAELLGRLL
ncbi:MarR family transcriptional regulator [Agromyces sp. SYSU K20354]|uniref:MarR family winged helix-turn-helix transcriptional regulator n=1 Tax=Agromyces cavernae TaxID=2898659 RepID=UPI001E64B264|nr:MarR family transcriptional regulator [Agromyces cavernae]MCD2443237.1 MarR family transcriptional regulator [Agromyces cavernae]